VTVGTNGQFNQTFTFIVPHSYGGYHDVEALPVYCGLSNSESDDPCLEEVAETSFTVTPTLIICNEAGTTCGDGSTDAKTVSVNANTRGLVSAVGTGYEPRWIYINIDGASYSDCETYIAPNGDFYLNFTTAGFRPGLHQFETWSCSEGDLNGVPNDLAYFNVTTIGDYVSGGGGSIPQSVITDITTIKNNVNTILGWQSIITGMNDQIDTISDHVSTILGWQSIITGMDTHINTILSGLTALTTTVNTIDTHVSSIISTLAPLPAKVDTAAANALAASNAATNAKNSVSSTETYVLVVAVLAAITLVLELAILVRKLD
jgi:hypothetical protein